MDAAHIARLLAQPPVIYTTGGNTWELRHWRYIDTLGQHWHWDGHDFDQTAGPEMISDEHPGAPMPLIGLVKHCGLRSDPADSIANGAMVLQIHDEIEAGIPHPEVRDGVA